MQLLQQQLLTFRWRFFFFLFFFWLPLNCRQCFLGCVSLEWQSTKTYKPHCLRQTNVRMVVIICGVVICITTCFCFEWTHYLTLQALNHRHAWHLCKVVFRRCRTHKVGFRCWSFSFVCCARRTSVKASRVVTVIYSPRLRLMFDSLAAYEKLLSFNCD